MHPPTPTQVLAMRTDKPSTADYILLRLMSVRLPLASISYRVESPTLRVNSITHDLFDMFPFEESRLWARNICFNNKTSLRQIMVL